MEKRRIKRIMMTVCCVGSRKTQSSAIFAQKTQPSRGNLKLNRKKKKYKSDTIDFHSGPTFWAIFKNNFPILGKIIEIYDS